MKALDLLRHLNGLKADLRPDTSDRILHGNPGQDVNSMAVCWMPYLETIQKARALGANTLVVHEPLFVTEDGQPEERAGERQEARDKMRLIDECGITVLRCHDAWDFLPELGIMDSWSRFLGLSVRTKQDHMYEVPETTALAFAEHVAARVSTIGQRVVRFYGDPKRRVRSVCTWCGWDSPYELIHSPADLMIAYDDNPVVRAWHGAELCHDTGYPLVVVNHGTLEEPGIASLAGYLARTFPDIPVTHIRQGCCYREVTAARDG